MFFRTLMNKDKTVNLLEKLRIIKINQKFKNEK